MKKTASHHRNAYYNEDCISGCRRIPDESVDLIVTDPPYGIEGDQLDRHYNRHEAHVIDGYIEIPQEKYADFSRRWISQAERILKPGGSIYIISGYTNLYEILGALRNTALEEVNHIIWKYNFGVHTTRKYVSSHYHILYYVKPGATPTFHTYCRYGPQEKEAETGRSLNYQDREDVWEIQREYKPGETKNKNELPTALLQKIIQYSSSEGDLVCDLFLGSFATAKVARGLQRDATGFEASKQIYSHHIREMEDLEPGYLLDQVREPKGEPPPNQGKRWTDQEKLRFAERYHRLTSKHSTKQAVIEELREEFGRGHFSVTNMIKELENQGESSS